MLTIRAGKSLKDLDFPKPKPAAVVVAKSIEKKKKKGKKDESMAKSANP